LGGAGVGVAGVGPPRWGGAPPARVPRRPSRRTGRDDPSPVGAPPAPRPLLGAVGASRPRAGVGALRARTRLPRERSRDRARLLRSVSFGRPLRRTPAAPTARAARRPRRTARTGAVPAPAAHRAARSRGTHGGGAVGRDRLARAGDAR